MLRVRGEGKEAALVTGILRLDIPEGLCGNDGCIFTPHQDEFHSWGVGSAIVEVCMTDGVNENVKEWLSFPPGAFVGQVACHECMGTGWWGYGPEEHINGPCIVCNGTGREWVGLL